MQSELFERFSKILKENAVPVLNRFQKDGEEILSAANIYTMVLTRIKQLRRAGLRKNMVLAAIADEMYCIVDLLACSYLQATYCPLNPMTLSKVIKQDFFQTENIKIDESQYILTSVPHWHVENKLYPLMVATSGSVSQKLVSYHEEGIIFQLEQHQAVFESYNFEHKLSVLPKFHCFGMVLDLLLGLWMKQYITFLSGNFTANDLSRVFKIYDIDVITCVPRQVDALLYYAQANANIKTHLSKIHVFYGGAPLKVSNGIQFTNYFAGMIEGYGLTEAGPGVLINGIPLKDIQLSLVEGQLQIASPSLADYDQKKSELLTEDHFKYKAGKYVFLGRSGDQIKNRRGTFETKLEVEKKISKKLGSDVYLIANKYELQLVELFRRSAMSMQMKSWIFDQYPGLKKITSINIVENRQILLMNNGKSNEDVLKNVIHAQGRKIWAS